MKKGLFVLFVMIILSVFVSAQVDSYNNYEFIGAQMSIGSSINASYGLEPYVEFFKAKSKIRPINDSLRQIVARESYFANPDDYVLGYEDGAVVFTWLNQEPNKFSFKILSDVIILNEIIKIKDKINFPPDDIPEEVKKYVSASEFIDINPEIKSKADELVEGETDYYSAVFDIASWVENEINYSLDTLTEDVVQKSSWVIQNKYGVCDELTNLFISMLRSIGIPARFTSGQAYSNVDNDFGNHGWAEVYFPGYGWVPFDITFKQFGWVDPSHIKIREQLDSGESAIEYNWKSRDATFQKGEIELKTIVTRTGPIKTGLSELKVEAIHDYVGTGSYVPIFATVTNKNDYYLPLSVFITKGPELTSKNSKSILLEPREERNLVWIVKVPEEGDPRYVYISMIEIKDMYGSIAITNLTYSPSFKRYGKEEAEKEALMLSPIPKKELLPGINFDCSFGKDYYYDNEKVIAGCIIENTGNTRLANIKVCLQDNCKISELGIGEKTLVEVQAGPFSMESGKKRFSLETERLVRYDYENLHIVSDPKLTLVSSEPKAIAYGGRANITLHTKSSSKAYNIKVNLENGGTAELNKINDKDAIILHFDTRDINSDRIKVKLTYEDETGREFIAAEKDLGEIVLRPFYAPLLYHFRRILR